VKLMMCRALASEDTAGGTVSRLITLVAMVYGRVEAMFALYQYSGVVGRNPQDAER
jgi:hypothetical protein